MHDEGYSINMSCALNLIFMFLLKKEKITKRILKSHLNSLNTNIPHFVGNPGTILGQTYKYGGVKSINGIPTLICIK
jgi:hypothetical protein